MDSVKNMGVDNPEVFEIINFKISNDPKDTDGKYNNHPAEINNIIVDLYQQALKGSHKVSDKLVKLIEKYPRVAVLYNYLGISYQKQGKMEKSSAVMKKCFSLFPDYLFARLAMAKEYMIQKDFEKADTMLGHKNLQGLYPERKVFHISEVINFYQCCAHVLITEGKFEAAESYIKGLNDIGINFNKGDLTNDLKSKIERQMDIKRREEELKILYQNQNENFDIEDEGFDEEDEEFFEVESTPKPWVENSTIPPLFHHLEIQWLYEEGLDIPLEKIKTLLSLPRQTLVEDLKKVIDDSCARYHLYKEEDWNEKKHNFMFHALWLLAELQAEEALPHALNVLRQDMDWLDFWFSDAVTENLYSAFYHLGQNRLDVLKDFIEEPNNYWTARAIMGDVVSLVATRQPQRRQEVLDWYTDVCQFFLDNKAHVGVSDYLLNGDLAEDILSFRGEELFPLLKKLFDAEIMDLMMTGDWDEMMEDYKNPETESELRELQTREEVYKDTADWGKPKKYNYAKPAQKTYQPSYGYTPTSTADSLKNIKSTPRNAPCPCKSGKKYKNCHGK
jgi:tetratricopeptide (TPR) repeat protein